MAAFGDTGKRKELGRALSRLRASSGLTQPKLAEKTGLTQAKISRIEGGKQGIRVPEVDAWCRATQASDDKRAGLLRLAEEIVVGPTSWDEAGEDSDLQLDAAAMEAKSGLISVYQPSIIPGLLQTAAYARRHFSSGAGGEPPNLAVKVMRRLERQRILYDETKRLRFIVPEAVARWPNGPKDEQFEQIERLREIATRPNVDLWIARMERTSAWRTSGFVLFEKIEDLDPVVHLELLTRPVNIEEPDQVDEYRQVFQHLARDSAGGEDALDILARVLGDFRKA